MYDDVAVYDIQWMEYRRAHAQTFKVDKAKVLSSEILDHLDAVHHDRSTEDVRENKDVHLLEGLSRLIS